MPKISTFGVPIGSATEERLNEPVAVQRVRCGPEDQCYEDRDSGGQTDPEELEELRPVDPRAADDGLYASVSVGYTHHDNIERTPDNEKSDGGLGIGLGLLFRNRQDRLSYQAGVQTSGVHYDEFTNNDFDDYLLSGGVLYELTDIVDLGLQAGYSSGDEERNSSGSRLVPPDAETDEVRTNIVGAQVTIGRPQSRIQFVLAGSHAEEDFTIRDPAEIAAGAVDLRDRDYDHVSGTVFYNTQGPIRYFLEGSYTEINYKHDSIDDLDSTDTGMYVGALWSVSAITSADFKIGQLDKNFKDPAKKDSDRLSYLGRVRWQPTYRTAFTFYGSQLAEETTEIFSDFYESRLLGVNLAFEVRPQTLDLLAYYNNIDDDFSSGRDDVTQDYGVGLVYHPRRWLGLGFRIGRSERDSNLPAAVYTDNYYDIFVQFNAGSSMKLF